MGLNVFKRRVDIMRERERDRDRDRDRDRETDRQTDRERQTRVTYGNSGTPGDAGVYKHNN